MPHDDIMNSLSQRLIHSAIEPTESIFSITMQDLLMAIINRLGAEALSLTSQQLLDARDEVQAAISHHLNEQELLAIGLDVWDITRNL